MLRFRKPPAPFRDHRILIRICGRPFQMLKAAPPFNTSAESLERFVSAIESVLAPVHLPTRFWQDMAASAARV
jgi:hypothetical protein